MPESAALELILGDEVRRLLDAFAAVMKIQAVIFSDSAEYDKNLRLLRGDAPVHFRTPDMSVDGVGFDADQDRKFVHIRSKVKIVIYPAARKRSGVGRNSADDKSKKEKK